MNIQILPSVLMQMIKQNKTAKKNICISLLLQWSKNLKYDYIV